MAQYHLRLSLADTAQRSISGDRFSFFIFIFCTFSIVVQILVILFSFWHLPFQVPLFYSKPWGEKMLAPPTFLWILPAIASLTMVLNFSIAIFLIGENLFLYRILVVFSGIVAVTTLYGLVKIISLLI